MKKLSLSYGGIAGIVLAVMMFLSFGTELFDMSSKEVLGYTSMIIAFSTIFIAIKKYRDGTENGTITFGKGFKVGLGITLVASVIYVATWMILSYTVASDFMTEYYHYMLDDLQASDLTAAEKEAKIAEMDKYTELYKNPFFKMGLTFMEIFPVGLIISLLSALILKKKPV